MPPTPVADLVLFNGRVLTLDSDSRIVEGIAVHGDRIVALGASEDMIALSLPGAQAIDLKGRAAIPGLIDGHAHADREGLKLILPSLAGARSIRDILDQLATIASRTPPGQWIILNPVGDPPEFQGVPDILREGRMPNRHDLDTVTPNNPVYIRPPWGYWTYKLPLLSVANSMALRLAGIDRHTASPSPLVTIQMDATSEPSGVFLEHTFSPIVEFTLLSMAPSFTHAQRCDALVQAMRIYNSVGTTSVFEGHGISADVLAAYQHVRNIGRQTLRAHLVFSPSWAGTTVEDIRTMLNSWTHWVGRRGLGDGWLRVADIFTQIDDTRQGQIRARIPIQTGWAGYSPDCGLPRQAVVELMMEAARNGIRIAALHTEALDLMAEVNRQIPLAGRRWILGHQFSFTAERIELIKELGLVLTTHTNRHIYKEGSAIRKRLGPSGENTIVPLRTLLDAGVPVAFGTDGLPPSMFMPIWQAVERVDGQTGEIIGPDQRISRIEALRCATLGGAYLTFEEDTKGSLAVGKLADIVILSEDPLGVKADQLPSIVAETTIVGGKEVYARSAA